MWETTRSALSVVLGFVLVLTLSATPGHARVIPTSQALALEAGHDARASVDAYLSRQDVATQLAALGVDPEVARLRAAALSTDELAALAGRIDEAPAGGEVITILGITFLVLLILELVGVIDIFKRA